ncbi:MAG: PH domain-containing protein, partial [Chitinophagaceae bacterium]|nr:PH domain-containing protein [Chitinophagaceae bacterium]
MITPLSLLALAIPVIMLVWILISTRYFIRNDTLTYQSGFLKGQIPIRNIRSVKTNTTLWMGTKPSLARKGMIIKYNQFREVFI